MTRAGLRYTRDYLTPGICSLIKPAAMEKLISFRAKNPHSHVIICGKAHGHILFILQNIEHRDLMGGGGGGRGSLRRFIHFYLRK